MRLRGIFWKPGVNGLGVGNMWVNRLLPYRKRFREAAKAHDVNYDEQGNSRDRRMWDIFFLEDMIKDCDNDLQVVFAIFYYINVRLWGWAFYRYNKD